MPLRIKAVGKTDTGLVREANEDYIHLDDKNHVYAVCDGMGGHQAGEVASMTAAETILKAFTHFRKELLTDDKLSIGRALPENGDLLIRSIRLANRTIHNTANKDSNLAGMGTTVVAVAFEADLVSVAHVGDSRAYLVRNGKLIPLTRDHSWVAEIQQAQNISEEEASSVVGKNVITRALGVRKTVMVDFRITKVLQGDKYILCSDGLCGYADDSEIFSVIRIAGNDISKITDNLVQMANDRGGSDNVSIISIEIQDSNKTDLPEVEVFTLPEENDEILAAEDAWIEKFLNVAKATDDKNKIDSGPNKFTLLGIFGIFVIAVALILWFLGK